jgi:hypothetical protein
MRFAADEEQKETLLAATQDLASRCCRRSDCGLGADGAIDWKQFVELKAVVD